MTTFEMVVLGLVAVVFLAMAWMIAEFTGMKNEIRARAGINNEPLRLKLQAYERLAMLTERISLHNLLSRMADPSLNAKQMQSALIDSIKAEYEYNVSQQVYVSADAWKAINNLKEQNIYIINQLAATIPVQGTAMDLNKRIAEYLMNNEHASLHNIVMDAVNYEAKKVMTS